MLHMNEGDFSIIPKGKKRCSICKFLVMRLLIEIESTLNNENTGGIYKRE